MGESPLLRQHPVSHPERLWIWDKAVYLDENRRTWLPIIIETETNLQVLMRQEDVPLGQAKTPSALGPYRLPLLWQRYPGKRYRGSDSSFWRIIYHVKLGGVEDLLLEQMPDPESETE